MRSAVKLTVVLLLAAMVTTASAQHSEEVRKNGIENLKVALKSDNPGLKRSAVYMIYKYNVNELVEVMKEEFAKSDDTAFKVFLARTIYKVGGEEEMNFLKTVSETEIDQDVKTICAVLYNHHLDAENLYYANN